MPHLTAEQFSAVDEGHALTDPRTNREYVLVSADLAARWRALTADNGLSKAEVGELIERALREFDEDDPALESYQSYRK